MDDGKRDTRADLLDAALEIVAARGLQALTHRGGSKRVQAYRTV